MNVYSGRPAESSAYCENVIPLHAVGEQVGQTNHLQEATSLLLGLPLELRTKIYDFLTTADHIRLCSTSQATIGRDFQPDIAHSIRDYLHKIETTSQYSYCKNGIRCPEQIHDALAQLPAESLLRKIFHDAQKMDLEKLVKIGGSSTTDLSWERIPLANLTPFDSWNPTRLLDFLRGLRISPHSNIPAVEQLKLAQAADLKIRPILYKLLAYKCPPEH